MKIEKKLKENEFTEAIIAEAIRVIIESAKTSLKTKNNAQRQGKTSVAKRSKTRYELLDSLTDSALDKLINENKIQVVGYYRQKLYNDRDGYNYLLSFSVSGVIFYKSVDKCIARKHKYIEEIDDPSEESVSSALKFTEAQKILESYLQKVEG